MSLVSTLVAVAIAALACSYAWGMRGCALGAEKGAMLPGAMLGLVMAWATGNEVVRENFLVFAAIGSIGMFCGGTETYGQTMGFIINHKPSENYQKGMTGLMMKGGLWFGIFAGFMGIGYSFVCGSHYTGAKLIFILTAMMLLRWVGVFALNNPFNPEKGKFPKAYFSKDRREEWGGLLVVLICLLYFAVSNGDDFTAKLILFGVFGGAFGWAVAIEFYNRLLYPLKNGRYIFDKMHSLKLVDGWKVMEFTLGAIGGGSVMLGQCLFFDELKPSLAAATEHGFVNLLGSFERPLMLIYVAAWFVCTAQFGIVTLLKKDGKAYVRFMDVFQRLFYVYIPLILVLFGSKDAAWFSGLFLLCWVLVEKLVFEQFPNFKNPIPISVASLAACLAVGVAYVFFDVEYSMLSTWMIYLISYELLESIWEFRPKLVKKNLALKAEQKLSFVQYLYTYQSKLTVHVFFAVQICVLAAFGIAAF